MDSEQRAHTDEWLAVPPPAGEKSTNGGGRRSSGRERRRDTATLRDTASQVEGHERSLSETRLRLEGIEARAREAQDKARAAEERAAEAVRLERELRAELAHAHEAVAANTAGELERVENRFEARDAETNNRVDEAAEALLEFPRRARQLEERVTALEQRGAEAATPPIRSTPPGPSSAAPGVEDEVAAVDEPVDINLVSFDQLREIGLSVTQAARLLASRDARGRFRSLDELRELWGFSGQVVDRLKQRLRLD